MSKVENDKMVEMLAENGYLSSERVIKAFKKVDRENFVPLEQRPAAY